MLKQDFLKQIIDGIKAGRLDPCNSEEFGEIYTGLPQYYWTVEGDQVVEESPFYVDDKQPKFRFGISVSDIEGCTEKEIGALSTDDVKQAMLDIIDEYGVDYWYDEYQQSLEMED